MHKVKSVKMPHRQNFSDLIIALHSDFRGHMSCTPCDLWLDEDEFAVKYEWKEPH